VFSFFAGLWYHFTPFNPKPKTSIMKIFLLSLLAAMTASAQVVFVDMGALIQRHPRTATDTAALEKRFKEIETEIANERTALEKMQAEFEAAVEKAQNPALSAAAKKKEEDAAKRLRDDLVERDRQASALIQLRRGQLAEQEEGYLKRTTDDIRNGIEVVSKRKGYKAVLPKALAIYADDSLEITEEVAKALGFDPLPADAKVRSTTIFP